MSPYQKDEFSNKMDIDFAIHTENNMRFRVNAFQTLHGPAAALRFINAEVPTIESLKLPNIVTELCNLHKGLILVTGATGSGKSTTLAAIVNYINTHYPKHIITIEDPIEYIHYSNKSLVNQRELLTHSQSFSNALKASLREDPDVILVGELRDLETIRLALTAAETGHLVLATLHTSSACKSIDRIIDVFPEGDKTMARTMLASSLNAVITQVLAKRLDGKGRIALHEILLTNSAIRNLIRENKIQQIQSAMQTSSKSGMSTMQDAVERYVVQNIISKKEAAAILNECPHDIKQQSQ